jgi:NitT/TauT family transport system ATP-binding protein
MTAALKLSAVTVRFTRDDGATDALRQVDLEVPAGQLVVLIGPSGCGKSTLLNVMAGLLAPTEGTVLAAGNEVRAPDARRGVVFQQDTAFPWMRVEDNVAYGLRAAGMAAGRRRAVVDEYLDAVGLGDHRSAWPKELSGGMRKRVAIATAFAADPDVLLMDEPFGSLDFVTRARLHALLLALWERTGKTIVFVTHDVDEALLLADRVVVLAGGAVVDDLAVAFPRPRTDDLRSDRAAIELRRHLLERLGLAEAIGASGPAAA